MDADTLSHFLGRGLSEQTEAEIQEHLDRCSTCFQLVRDLVACAPALAAAVETPRQPVPPGRREGAGPTGSEDGAEPARGDAATALADADGPGPEGPVGRWRPPARFDEFRLLRPLGQGAMGQVYLAQDTHLDRQVAVKFIASEAPSEQARQRFLREARALARLSHPAVVAAYRYGAADGRPFLVSEFIRGQPLNRLALPVPWQEGLRLAKGLARGLGAAHRSGVLHRDIKPANVILADSGEVKLLDFGLAKIFDEPAQALDDTVPVEGAAPAGAPTEAPGALTQAGALVGTPLYMAPESWRGVPATPQTDVYSLGAVVYELVSGKPPHRGDSQRELRAAVQAQDAPALATVAPGVDRRFAAVIDRCLRRDPAARYASGEELSQALAALTRGPVRLRPRHWAGIALGLGALVAAPVYLTQRQAASLAREAQLLATLPSQPEARRLYREGLALLQYDELTRALPLLERTVALEPAFPLGHAALAGALAGLGSLDRGRAEADQALGLCGTLSRQGRLYCEGLAHDAKEDPQGALERYQALFAFYPDNLEYGLKLAQAQVNVDESRSGKEVRQTVAALRALPPPLREDGRIDLVEAWAAYAREDIPTARAAAARGAGKAKAQGAQQLLADARGVEAWIELRYGDTDRAVAAATEATQLLAIGGRRVDISLMLDALGVTLFKRGDLAQARHFVEQRVDNDRRLGRGKGFLADGLKLQARILAELGELDPAQRVLEEMLRLEQAERAKDDSIYKDGAYALVDLLRKRGDLAGARARCEEALTRANALEARRTYEERSILAALLGGLLLDGGDVAAARARLTESQALLNQHAPRSPILPSVHRLLAEVALAEGHLADAEALARKATAGFGKGSYHQADSLAVLALALLGQGRPAEAAEAIRQARERQGKGEAVATRMAVARAGALVRAASAQPGEVGLAMQDLGAVAAEAGRLGLVGEELAALLALGEVELRSAPRAGRARLRALSRDAAARGFGLIAARAAAPR